MNEDATRGEGLAPASAGKQEGAVVRHEEELRVGKQAYQAGSVRVRKRIESERVRDVVPRDVEHADVERVGPLQEDSGKVETLADGSVSIPIFEEELVVTKRVVVRERVIIRKRTVTEQAAVEADVRREHIDIESDDS